MKLIDILSFIKTIYSIPLESYTIGTIDTSKEKALCIYDEADESEPITSIGGVTNSGYNAYRIKILLRYGTNKNLAEAAADELYNTLLERKFNISDKNGFVMMNCHRAISLYTDEKGVYEYAVKLTIYYER